MSKPPITQRIPIAVLLHADGLVQAFGPEHVDVRFSIVPRVDNVANEALAIELAERQLHKKYREICFPGNLRGSEILRTITPLELLQRSADMELLHAVESLSREVEAATKTAATQEAKKGRKIWMV